MKLTLVAHLGECERMPFGYGVAWQDWSTRTFTCLPIPFNVIASRARAFYLWVLFGCWQSAVDRRIHSAVAAERAYQSQRDFHEDEARRRRDFRAGYEYAHDYLLSELTKDKPKPKMPEWAK